MAIFWKSNLANIGRTFADFSNTRAIIGSTYFKVSTIFTWWASTASGNYNLKKMLIFKKMWKKDKILLHVQQTPYPWAHEPSFFPPRFEHSSLNN